MEALVLIGGFALMVLGGLWCMDGLDRFLTGGTVHPHWDETQERQALCPHAPSARRAIRLGRWRLMGLKGRSWQ